MIVRYTFFQAIAEVSVRQQYVLEQPQTLTHHYLFNIGVLLRSQR